MLPTADYFLLGMHRDSSSSSNMTTATATTQRSRAPASVPYHTYTTPESMIETTYYISHTERSSTMKPPVVREQPATPTLTLTRENLRRLNKSNRKRQTPSSASVGSAETGHDVVILHVREDSDSNPDVSELELERERERGRGVKVELGGVVRRRRHRHHTTRRPRTPSPPPSYMDLREDSPAHNYNPRGTVVDVSYGARDCACRGCHDEYAASRLSRWQGETVRDGYWNSVARPRDYALTGNFRAKAR